jgi:signal transduction histidine kinase
MSQTGRIKYDPARVNLLEVVNEKLSLFVPMARMKNIEICHEIPQNLNVFADKNMLMLILRNLITNAIKFTYSGGIIKIGAVKSGDTIEIFVEDNGVGMDNDTVEHIFKIDSRYTSIGTNKEKGTGLGLILCKEFVEKNNGKILVESQVKKGTKFIFILPSC